MTPASTSPVALLRKVHSSVVAMLAATAASQPAQAALVDRERSIDYAQYLACVGGFAHELQGLGAQGERVATLLGNSIEACVAQFAALAAGAQLVPLNPLLTESELAPILRDAEVRVLVVHASLLPMAGQLAADTGVAHLIVVGAGTRLLDAWSAGSAVLPALPQTGTIALLQYTGGTTGRAKGVELTHAAIATNVAQREALLPSQPGERVLCVMPLSHAYGMAMGLFLAVGNCGTLVVLPRYHCDDVFDCLQRERITVFPGSPTVFVGLMAHPRFAQTDWSRLHTCYSGGAALAAGTLARWTEAVGAPIFEGYGMTEAGPVLTFNPACGPVKPGSVGVPVPLTEIEIVDVESGCRVLGPGERGEIRARGPQCMRGYRHLAQESALALRQGWLYTGDIGSIDGDGYLFIQDRKKDMVIVGGYNVYPREVEEVLFAHPDVVDAAVIGVPDDYSGERLVAHVVTGPGTRSDANALLAWCAQRLAKYKLPAQVRFAAALPKTPASKTDKVALRQSETNAARE